MRGYHVFLQKIVEERIEANSADEACIAALDLHNDAFVIRVEVTADDGGVDEVVV